MNRDYVKRYKEINKKWWLYKTLRAQHPEMCIVGTPHFIDWREREDMFEELLRIIRFSKDD